MSTAASRNTLISRRTTISHSIQATLQNTAVREFLAEFIGTFILVAVGDASVAAYLLKNKSTPVDTLATCFCFGIGAIVGISASINISGGHINPAVTVAFAAFKKFPWSKVWYYLISQYLGGFFAAGLVYWTYAESIASFDGGVRSAFGNESSTGGIFATYPAPYVSIFGSFIDQVIGTAILLFAVLAITDDNNIKTPKGLQPMVLGFMIAGVCTAYSLNCGAILNPARDLAPRLFTSVAGYGWEPFQVLGGHYWWVAGVVGPHVGAIVGVAVYLLTIDQRSFCQGLECVATKETADGDAINNQSNGSGNLHLKETAMNGEKQQTITMP